MRAMLDKTSPEAARPAPPASDPAFAASPAARRSPLARLAGRLETRMLALALALAAALSFATPYFLVTRNLLNVLDQSVVVGIVAIGMTFVILTGGIDLSVGSLLGLTGVLLGLAMPRLGVPLAVLFAIGAGAAIGALSGTLIARFNLAAFVVTLGVMSIGRSLAYILSGNTSITDIPSDLSDLVYAPVLGLPLNVAILIALYLLAWLYLSFTKGGRTIYAIGSNREAARAAGLNVTLYAILPYAISGAMSAIAAVLVSLQILSIDPEAGKALELDAIAAVVIGGASLYGGRGTIVGTLIGVFIMVVIRNGLNLLGVSPFWQGSAIGEIIIAAVLAERLASGRAQR